MKRSFLSPYRRSRDRIGRPIFYAWAAVIFLLCAWLPALAGPPAIEEPRPVMLLEVRGVIDPIIARYIQRGIATGSQNQVELIVIQLDTPGGLDTAMRDIVQAILNADTPVAVFVAPRGARAASAGVFIAAAGHIAAMAPGTNIGAAHPVQLGGEQGEPPAALQDKVTNDAATYIQAIAQQRGRNAGWLEDAVRKSASLTDQQALEKQVIDLVVADLDELLSRLDGRQVRLNSRTITLRTAGKPVQMYPLTFLEVIAHGIVDPNIAYVLLSLGTLALVAEFYQPGAILPGVTGVIALILGFVALGSLPVNWGGIALILLAIIFFIADIKVSGIALTVAGAIAFVLGSILLFSPFSPPMHAMQRVAVNPWLITGMTAFLVGFFAFALAAGIRAQRHAVLVGAHVLPGKTGVAVSDLLPEGVVHVDSEMWSAVADGDPVHAGEAVEVIGRDGLRLQVRRRNP